VDAVSELATGVRLLAQLVDDLDATVTNEPLPNVDTGFMCWTCLEETNGHLATIRQVLVEQLALAMSEKRVTVMGVGTFERRRSANRTTWDKDLYRAVLDTRLVNPATGEVLDETPLEKVLHVWNLGAPRVTALRARGIDPDEWCEVEYGRLTIRKVG
jgi:hypothetical protein